MSTSKSQVIQFWNGMSIAVVKGDVITFSDVDLVIDDSQLKAMNGSLALVDGVADSSIVLLNISDSTFKVVDGNATFLGGVVKSKGKVKMVFSGNTTLDSFHGNTTVLRGDIEGRGRLDLIANNGTLTLSGKNAALVGGSIMDVFRNFILKVDDNMQIVATNGSLFLVGGNLKDNKGSVSLTVKDKGTLSARSIALVGGDITNSRRC